MRVFNGVFVIIIIAYLLTVFWTNRDKSGDTSKKPETVQSAETPSTEAPATAAAPSASAPAPAPPTTARRLNAVAPNPAVEGRAQAALLYPELATPDSEVNKKFVALFNETQSSDPGLLSHPDWPLTLVERAVAATGGTVIPRNSAAAQVKMGRQVVLFGTSHCHVCGAARAYLAKRGISYQEYDIETSPSAKETFRRLGGTGTPLILIGNKKLQGFEAKELDELIL
jgi:glutaredoxin